PSYHTVDALIQLPGSLASISCTSRPILTSAGVSCPPRPCPAGCEDEWNVCRLRYISDAYIRVVNTYCHPACVAITGPVATAFTTAWICDCVPLGVIRKPATQFASTTAFRYKPPITPFDAASKLTSPCCSVTAPPNSIFSMNWTSV